MKYGTRTAYKSSYKFAGRNQHGDRFKFAGMIPFSVCTITAALDDATELQDLVILSDRLQTPLRWNFADKPQTASIEIVSYRDAGK